MSAPSYLMGSLVWSVCCGRALIDRRGLWGGAGSISLIVVSRPLRAPAGRRLWLWLVITRLHPIPDVSVAWSDEAVVADEFLAEEMERLLHVRANRVRVGRLCRACGSGTHGRPIVVGRQDVHLSLARCGEWTLVALSRAGSVGVDIESAHPRDHVAVGRAASHPLERPEDARGTAVLWTRKESLLKATGHGLRISPDSVRISDPGQSPRLLVWPAEGGDRPAVWMADLQLAEEVVAAVTLLLAVGQAVEMAGPEC